MYLCGQKGDFFLLMKQKKMLLFFCLISLLLTGCRHRPAMDFAAIEALLPSRPDSVVTLLKPVNPERFVTADKAHYYLLLAEAEERQLLFHRYLSAGYMSRMRIGMRRIDLTQRLMR